MRILSHSKTSHLLQKEKTYHSSRGAKCLKIDVDFWIVELETCNKCSLNNTQKAQELWDRCPKVRYHYRYYNVLDQFTRCGAEVEMDTDYEVVK